MEADKSKSAHIDTIRRRFGITLAAVSRYNSLNRDEIKNSIDIFRMQGSDREKVLALLYMVTPDEHNPLIRKFRDETGMDDERYDSCAPLVDRYGTMFVAALIYNPQFYAMAINYFGAVNAGFAAAENTDNALDAGKKNKDRIIPLPVSFRMTFAAAAVLVVILFIVVLVRLGSGAGQRISNDWIAGLTAPLKGQDGISFVSAGNEGARIGIKSPLAGMAMAANDTAPDVTPVVEYYTKAIRTEKNNSALYVNRGIAYTLQGYIDSAIKDFKKAIELDPRNTSAYFNRAVAYAGKGAVETDNAIADLMMVIAINPDDSETYYALGALYFRQYEFDEIKPHTLLEKAMDAFSHIQGYKDADIIFDYLSRLL